MHRHSWGLVSCEFPLGPIRAVEMNIAPPDRYTIPRAAQGERAGDDTIYEAAEREDAALGSCNPRSPANCNGCRLLQGARGEHGDASDREHPESNSDSRATGRVSSGRDDHIYTNARTHPCEHANSNAYPYAQSDSNIDILAHHYSDSQSNQHTNPEAHEDTFSHSYSDRDTNAGAY